MSLPGRLCVHCCLSVWHQNYSKNHWTDYHDIWWRVGGTSQGGTHYLLKGICFNTFFALTNARQGVSLDRGVRSLNALLQGDYSFAPVRWFVCLSAELHKKLQSRFPWNLKGQMGQRPRKKPLYFSMNSDKGADSSLFSFFNFVRQDVCWVFSPISKGIIHWTEDNCLVYAMWFGLVEFKGPVSQAQC